jgi:hypothetical protein
MVDFVRCQGTDKMVVPVSETWKSGEVRATSDARVGVVQALNPRTEGQDAVLALYGDYSATSPVAFAAGVQAGMILSTQTLCASGTVGSVDIGRVKKAVAVGGTVVIELNRKDG